MNRWNQNNKNGMIWTALLLALITVAAFWFPRTPIYSDELIDASTTFMQHVSENRYDAGLQFVFKENYDTDYEAALTLSIQAKDEYEDFISSPEANLIKTARETDSVVVENLVFASGRWFGRTTTTYRDQTGKEHKIIAAWIRTPNGEWKLTDI